LDAGRIKVLFCGKKVVNDEVLKTLIQIKYDIICVKNFRKLLDVASRESVKLVIFDMTRKKKEQLQILNQLKEKLPDIIIVVVNGSEKVQDAAEILAAGAADVFPSPYDSKLLAERVNGLLR
jgi:DNA-binding NtrC family response regulator